MLPAWIFIKSGHRWMTLLIMSFIMVLIEVRECSVCPLLSFHTVTIIIADLIVLWLYYCSEPLIGINLLSVFLHHWIFHTSARFIFLYYWNCSPSSKTTCQKYKSLHNLMMPFYLTLTSAVSHIPFNQSKLFCNPLSLVDFHFPTWRSLSLILSFSTYYKCYSTSFTSLQFSRSSFP